MITVLIKIALALLAGASLFAACSQSGTNGAGEGGSPPAAEGSAISGLLGARRACGSLVTRLERRSSG